MRSKKLATLLLIPVVSCSQNMNVIEDRVFCFDTYVDIRLYEGNKDNVKDIADILNKYDALSDNYLARSGVNNVYTLNQTNEEVTVDESLYKLLKASYSPTDFTASNFNILCGSLAKKWKESLSNKEVLSETVILEELEKIKNSSLLFKENNVVQRMGEAEIDLGGSTKGYVLDEVYTYLIEQKITHYLVNAGKSSILLGKKKTVGETFTVGLSDLPNAYMKLKDCYISTSGSSMQGVTIDGVKYSHIVNPSTGSVVSEYDAVIVICDNGLKSDVMSTSLTMNTLEEIKTIEEEQNIKVIVIKDQKVIYKNDSIEVYYR